MILTTHRSRIYALLSRWRLYRVHENTRKAIKILIAVVLGALLLAGLYALLNETVLPTLTQRIKDMFNYAGYVGDMLLQKTYSEDALPYRKQKNKGELPKYYVKNTHEPIVEQIQFELANILLKERSTYICSQHGEYPLSRKIKCSECGTTYRRKETNTAIYWVCRTHDRNKADCTSQRITQDAVYGAFIRMYNKLKQNYSVILLPMLDQLEKLQMAQQRNNPQLNTLNKQIAELSEQNHVMTGLLSSGILDSALFISQTDELNRKIRALKLAKARLLEENQADGLTDKTEDLIELLENGPACISEMNENLLADMVEKIIAHDTESINFILTNGLGLTERL